MLKHITIILPIPYRGGSLRVTKTIARMIKLGSANAGQPCDVRVAVLREKYDVEAEFSDLISEGIDIREFNWRHVTPNNVRVIKKFQEVIEEAKGEGLLYMPEDGVNNLHDTDFWLLVSDRTDCQLAPIKPYAVFATDYIQRYVPEIFPKDEWGNIDMPFLETTRAANGVITTTPQTRLDAIAYAGIVAEKVHLAPMDFDPTSFPAINGSVELADHIVWPTNTTQHKNQMRAFEALKHYYERLGGKLKVKVVGPNSTWMDPETTLPSQIATIEYIQDMRRTVKASPTLQGNVEFCGELSDAEYARTVASAQFLWHPVLYDNGTFAVAEAALLGCPSLSSGYPQMRYIGERFSIPMEFFSARSVTEMAESLKAMETKAPELRKQLPTREALSKHSWQNYADEYWQMLNRIPV